MNFIDFKLQDATTICTDALQSRGFQVREHNGYISFLQSSSKNDMCDAVAILNKLGVPYVTKDDNLIEIIVNKVPLSIYSKVARFGGKPYSIAVEMCHTKWRYFHNHRFGVRLDALDIEYNMATFVKMANLAGIRVISGCNGHKKNSPRFQVVGPYYGAWFEVVQQTFMADLHLNYKWEVKYQGYTQAEIRASGGNWNMDLIHQDTLKMAKRLSEHAEEIRNLKSKAFRKKELIPKQLVKENNYDELVKWMMQCVKVLH